MVKFAVTHNIALSQQFSLWDADIDNSVNRAIFCNVVPQPQSFFMFINFINTKQFSSYMLRKDVW